MHRTSGVSSIKRIRPTALRRALLSALYASFASTAIAQAPPPAQPAQAPPVSPQSTQAGPDDAETLDTIVVTGIRGSIQSSIERKRDATVVADVLSAEDIGELPALSIGEAIETITGASTHREKGGASEIAIRGLGPFLGSASFNGREATNGSGDRSVNFNQFPSELINTVSIYKTQRADFIEGGVAGTINMETVQPLDFGKQRIQIEGRGLYAGYQVSLERLGCTGLGRYRLARHCQLSRPVQVRRRRTRRLARRAEPGNDQPGGSDQQQHHLGRVQRHPAVAATANCNAPTTDPNRNLTPANYDATGRPPYYLVPGSRTYRQIIDKDKRDAAFAAVQWRPNDTLEIGLDYQWSDRVYTEDRADLVFSETLRGLSNRVVDDNGILRGYTGNSTIESTPTYRIRSEQYNGGGLSLDWRPSPAWTLSTDLSFSRTYRSEMDRTVRMRSNSTDINNVAVPGVINGQRVNYTFDYSGDCRASSSIRASI